MRQYQRALITGATSGIGAAFAAELPAATHLLLTGRDGDRHGRVAEKQARPGREVDSCIADLTRIDEVDALAARADAAGIDLLINNAGSGRFGRFVDNPAEAEIAAAQLNVVAVVALTRRLLPGMIARARAAGRRCGVIILSSTAGLAPVPFFATYAATKAFDLHFAEALADEMRGEPVDLLALCPGATRTSFGTRAGFESGNLPGAVEPRSVAREGLDALGRRTVHVAGFVNQAAFGPMVAPRRLVTGALGIAMRLIAPRPR
jgi:hypothetical protein